MVPEVPGLQRAAPERGLPRERLLRDPLPVVPEPRGLPPEQRQPAGPRRLRARAAQVHRPAPRNPDPVPLPAGLPRRAARSAARAAAVPARVLPAAVAPPVAAAVAAAVVAAVAAAAAVAD